MADPVSIAAIGSLAATGFGVTGKLQQGSAQAAGAKQAAAQAARAAQIGQLKATQTDTFMRDDLTSTLANIDAIHASANSDPGSPTSLALDAHTERVEDQNRVQRVANINSQAASDRSASEFYRRSAGSALLGGYLGAVGTGLSALAGAAGGFKPGGAG